MKKRNLRAYAVSTCLVLGLLLVGCGGTDKNFNSATSDEINQGNVSTDNDQNNEDETANSDNASSDNTSSDNTSSDSTSDEAGSAVSSADYKNGVSDEDATFAIIMDGIQSAEINSHQVEEVSSSDYGDEYIACDTVNATYIAGDMTGILPQTVTKDFEFYFNKNTSEWERLSDTTTACKVDNSALPGSSWKCTTIDPESLKLLFGDDISSPDSGELYIHFLKRVGLFSFNLNNELNTSFERFFTTVQTSGKLNWVSADGVIEKSFSIANGSVTDAGIYSMEINAENNKVNLCFGTDVVLVTEHEYDSAIGLEVDESKVYIDTLTRFDLTSASIADGEWKTETGLKEKNISPELTWDAVDGASKYAVIMIDDTTANKWLHWFTIVDKTHLDEGEFTDSTTDYAGPYPPETHNYDVYVVALAEDPGDVAFKLDTPGGDIAERLTSLNNKTDGSTGNVLAYGLVEADYTPASDYYGDR